MTQRPKISLFRTPQKPAEPVCPAVGQIPIRVVSRAAVEALVKKLKPTVSHG